MPIIRQCQQVSGMKPGYFKKMRKNEVTIGQNLYARPADVVTLPFTVALSHSFAFYQRILKNRITRWVKVPNFGFGFQDLAKSTFIWIDINALLSRSNHSDKKNVIQSISESKCKVSINIMT